MVSSNEQLQCYLVGGAVRDELLGRPSPDRDWVVVGATEQQLLSLDFLRLLDTPWVATQHIPVQ